MSRASTTADFDETNGHSALHVSLTRRLLQALTIRRQRRALLSLDDRMLADVGISRADAYREAHRPFLDVPVPASRHNSW